MFNELQKSDTEFMTLYVEFKKAINIKNKDQFDLFRIKKLEQKIDNLWSAIPDDKRNIVFKDLVSRQLVPAEAQRIVDLFNGKVVKV